MMTLLDWCEECLGPMSDSDYKNFLIRLHD